MVGTSYPLKNTTYLPTLDCSAIYILILADNSIFKLKENQEDGNRECTMSESNNFLFFGQQYQTAVKCNFPDIEELGKTMTINILHNNVKCMH